MRGGVRVVPVVQHVHEKVGVETVRHPDERVTSHGREARARDGARDHVGQIEHGALEVRHQVQQGREEIAGATTDIADARAARPVERSREREPVHAPAGRHRAVERAGPVRVLAHPVEERPAVRGREPVARRRRELRHRTRHVGAARELDPRAPATRMVGAQELRHARRRHPARAVEAHPAARRRVAQQAFELCRVGVDATCECSRLCRLGQCVGDAGRAQRDEHAVVEHAEESLEDADGRRCHRRVHAAECGAHAVDAVGDEPGRHARDAEHGPGKGAGVRRRR